MRQSILLSALAVSLLLPASALHAQGVLYRCESADGISIQGAPCPKGVSQRKIAVQRPVDAPVAPTPPAEAATAAQSKHDVPLAPANAMHGPNNPYPLWQCMRADGSTFDSRNGIPGKQWVVKPLNPDRDADDSAAAPAQITTPPKLHEHIVQPFSEAVVAEDAAAVDATPPPPGAAPGQWIADQCIQLDAQQACESFATRRDALRKQIYASKPSERSTYAPEEQDLTSMLYAACGR